MNHRVSVKKLSKTPAHRKAMIRNMLIALFREETIKTTHAKARVLKRFAEKLITCARKDGVHNRRMAAKWVQDKAILNKLFTEIGPKYVQRPGGYTRVIKLGPRRGDASEMAYIQLVEDEVVESHVHAKKAKSNTKRNVGQSSKGMKINDDKPSEIKAVPTKEISQSDENAVEEVKVQNVKAEENNTLDKNMSDT